MAGAWEDFEKSVDDFVKRLEELVNEHYAANFPNLKVPTCRIDRGPTYFRIVLVENPDTERVWGFIATKNMQTKHLLFQQGDIARPASWSRPAKHARGNIFDEDGGMKYAGPYGPHLLTSG